MKNWPMTFPSAGCQKNTTGNMHQPTLWSMRRAPPTSVPSVSAAFSRAMSTELSSKRADWEVRGTKPGDMDRWDRNRNLRRRCVTNNVNHHHHHPSAPPPPHHYHQHRLQKYKMVERRLISTLWTNRCLSTGCEIAWSETLQERNHQSTCTKVYSMTESKHSRASGESWLVNTD